MLVNTKSKKGLLVVFGGLPGSGKTSIAKELATVLQASYLRIDTIEQTLVRENCLKIGHEGYFIAYALAQDNLCVGNTIIVDSVNSSAITRESWHQVVNKVDASILEVEVICSDKKEHQRRVKERSADIIGHKLPTWDDVISRDYQNWVTKDLIIDTAKLTIHNAVREIVAYLEFNQTKLHD